MINYWLDCWRNIFNYSDRARRSEYWYFTLMNTIITYGSAYLFRMIDPSLAMISTIYSFVSLLPNIAVLIRRAHDTNNSGWMMLIPIYNFILACTEGTRGENRFGSDPKNPTSDNYNNPDILDA